MAFELNDFNVMEYLWETLAKTSDGKRIRYSAVDVEELWRMGFVDTQLVSLAEWKAVFEPHRKADGSYEVGKGDFLALDRYRYKGEIRIPFDAMQINEGKYTDEGLDDLIAASIAPSCGMGSDKLKSFFDDLKNEFRDAGGLIEIRGTAKERIRALLDAHPSPLRNLELLLDRMIESGEDALFAEGMEVDAVTMQAAREVQHQASSFSTTPTTRAETKASGLRALEKSRKKKAAEVPSPGDEKEKVDLGKLKRSKRRMRG